MHHDDTSTLTSTKDIAIDHPDLPEEANLSTYAL
jgi:hypothetical protein